MRQKSCFGKVSSDTKATMFLLCVAGMISVANILLKDSPVLALAQNTSGVMAGTNPEMASKNDGLLSKNENQSGKRELLREGTTIQSRHVVFRVTKNRVLMTPVSGSEHFYCLENLNLQRIADVIRQNPTLTDWEVDFLITEYQGINYVLIQRAVLTSTNRREESLEKLPPRKNREEKKI